MWHKVEELGRHMVCLFVTDLRIFVLNYLDFKKKPNLNVCVCMDNSSNTIHFYW